jgi:uncharacterized membrane protein YccC
MKNIFRLSGVFIGGFVLTSLMLSSTAHAYIDPAATSYLIQIIAGAVIACSVVVGVFFKKIKLFFRNLKIKMLERKLSKTHS